MMIEVVDSERISAKLIGEGGIRKARQSFCHTGAISALRVGAKSMAAAMKSLIASERETRVLCASTGFPALN